MGWETKKHLHALRARAGSLVWDRYGESEACQFCRHGKIEITRDCYSWLGRKFRDEDEPVKVGGKAVEWAKA